MSPIFERETIWEQQMTSSSLNLANWTKIADNVNPSSTGNGPYNCPVRNQHCWQVCGQSNAGWNAYIYRMASTKGYHHIQLEYSIRPYQVEAEWQWCDIAYTVNIDTDIDNGIRIARYSQSNNLIAYLDQVSSLHSTADDNDGVAIFVQAWTDGDWRCCHIRDFKLTGIPLPTSEPTNTPTIVTSNPTSHPAIMADPTLSPTEIPTVSPSSDTESPSNQPSVAPTTTQPSSYGHISALNVRVYKHSRIFYDFVYSITFQST